MVPGVNPTAPEHQTSPRFPPPSYSTSQRRHSEMAAVDIDMATSEDRCDRVFGTKA